MSSIFLGLPDELILKVLSYTEIADLLSCGQVNKRIRTISDDNSLFQTVNLSGKCVLTDLLARVLNKGCKSLNLSNSSIWGNMNLIQNSQLRELDLSNCRLTTYYIRLVHISQLRKLDLSNCYGTTYNVYKNWLHHAILC